MVHGFLLEVSQQRRMIAVEYVALEQLHDILNIFKYTYNIYIYIMYIYIYIS